MCKYCDDDGELIYGFKHYFDDTLGSIYRTILGEGEIVDFIPRDSLLPEYSLRINEKFIPRTTISSLIDLAVNLKKLLGIPFETEEKWITRSYVTEKLGLTWTKNRCLWNCMFSKGVLQILDNGKNFDCFIPSLGWVRGLKTIVHLEWILEQEGLLRVLKNDEE